MVGKKLFLALLLALLPALASAQGPSSAQIEANKGNLKQVNVADLANANKSLMYRVMDGASADDCTVGSGTVQVPCYWDGTTWTAANGSGGSGDVTAVGDCASGACFAGSTGTTLTFNNAGGDGILSYDGTDFAFDKPIDVTGTIGLSSTLTLPDNVRQTFNPGANAAGLNVGSQAGDPGTPANGDIWYDSTGNTLDARINGATVSLGAGGGAPTDATYITQTANGSLSNEQALGALATGCLGSTTTTGVVAARTITGTSNEVSLANGDCSGNPTVSLPATIDLGGKTSFEIPNAAAPTTDAFGEIAGDNDAWAASRGAVQVFDGTANTYLVGTLASDTPANGESPVWNTGGTVTWGSPSASLGSNNIGEGLYGLGSTSYAWYGPSRVANCEDEAFNYLATGSCVVTSNSGTGSSCQIDTGYISLSGELHPGTVSCDTGTTTTGTVSRAVGYSAAALKLGATHTWIGTGIYILDDLSNGTETYTFAAGLYNPVNTDGCYVTYTHSANSGKFLLVAETGASQSTADSGVTVAADTWYDIRIVADGVTSCTYYINGTSAGSLNTNIPTGQLWGWASNMTKSAGTTVRQFAYDYQGVRIIFGSAR